MTAHSRIVIVAGGKLGAWAPPLIRPDDFLIGADRGALFLVEHGFRPHLSIGDFDSVDERELARIREASGEFRDCDPIRKDYTDTELAVIRALERRPDELLLFGALGGRFDHALANVHLLRRCLSAGVSAAVVDETNRIRLIDGSLTLSPSEYPYASLLPLTPEATGITLTGMAYPLTDATLRIGEALGVSNRVVSPDARVTVREGWLLVIESKD